MKLAVGSALVPLEIRQLGSLKGLMRRSMPRSPTPALPDDLSKSEARQLQAHRPISARSLLMIVKSGAKWSALPTLRCRHLALTPPARNGRFQKARHQPFLRSAAVGISLAFGEAGLNNFLALSLQMCV